MKDTFDFTSYVRSGRLHEWYNVPANLDRRILRAFVELDLANETVFYESQEWDTIVNTFKNMTGLEGEDLIDFLTGDISYKGAFFSEYMDELGISLDHDGLQDEPHQTTDTFTGPKGIEEVIGQVLKSKLTK
jgi:hypothetical protein